jgi:hypothetical protein
MSKQVPNPTPWIPLQPKKVPPNLPKEAHVCLPQSDYSFLKLVPEASSSASFTLWWWLL